MKIVFFNDFKLGIVKGESVIDVSDAVKGIPHAGPHDIISGLIANFDKYRGDLQRLSERGQSVPLSSVSLRPPLPHPANIDCMAVNYIEDPARSTTAPLNAFPKSPSAIIGDGDTMILPDVPATIFEGEAELAVVIGRRAANVKARDAMNYVFGYVNFIDGSARGLPAAGNLFYQMKSRNTFAPIGPWLVTADEVNNVNDLQIRLWNNGALMQDFNTRDMANKIPECIEFITSIHALEPGDIIATGTNHAGLNPFQDGDRIEIETTGLGKLHIRVKDDLKRTWARETRHERQQKNREGTTPQLTGKYTPAPK